MIFEHVVLINNLQEKYVNKYSKPFYTIKLQFRILYYLYILYLSEVKMGTYRAA